MNLNERLTKGKPHNDMPKKEPDTIDIYVERTGKFEPVNTQKTVFKSPMHKGINTDENVFDRNAVFKR